MNAHNETVVELEFTDNRLLSLLFGERDKYLQLIEDNLGILISARGNVVVLSGPREKTKIATNVLEYLYDRLEKGLVVSQAEVDAALRIVEPRAPQADLPQKKKQRLSIPTRKRIVTAQSKGQEEYIKILHDFELVFANGPAGTGKTYLAVAQAVSMLLTGEVDRLILSRPAVEAGEKLGFLPGNMREKIDPYLRPLYDALYDMLPTEQVEKRITSGEIEVAPLAFMRGRTLSRAFVILDEAQNTTKAQMKMFLTRLGEGSRMVITGDMTQVDLPAGTESGLKEALFVLNKNPKIGFSNLNEGDVVRHPLVSTIVKAYDQYEKKRPK